VAAGAYGVLVVGVGGGGWLRAKVERGGGRAEAAPGPGPGGEPWILSGGGGGGKGVGGEEEVVEARRVVEMEGGGEGHGWRWMMASGEGVFRGLGIFLYRSQVIRSFSAVRSLIDSLDQASNFLPVLYQPHFHIRPTLYPHINEHKYTFQKKKNRNINPNYCILS
jgi:hypothetical protein